MLSKSKLFIKSLLINGKSGTFREDNNGIIKAKDIVPYLSNSGVTVQSDGKVLDGSGGQYFTDYTTYNQHKFKNQNENIDESKVEEYAWVITYHFAGNDSRLIEKLQTKVDDGILIWKEPGQSLQYEGGKSKTDHYIGIPVLSFANGSTAN